MFKSPQVKGALTAIALLCASELSAEVAITGVGTPLSPEDLSLWDISVSFDGDNLPPGSGTLEAGEEIWSARCAMCHGDFGEGQNGYPKMLGADLEEFQQTAIDQGLNVEIRGINNMWAHAPTLFDMIRRAMPYFQPQSMTDDEAYAVTGYALYLADIIDEEVEVIDAEVLKSIEMPAASLYYSDPRPDVQNTRCLSDCVAGDLRVVRKTVVGDFGSVEKSE